MTISYATLCNGCAKGELSSHGAAKLPLSAQLVVIAHAEKT
jgi:hypothetical protein